MTDNNIPKKKYQKLPIILVFIILCIFGYYIYINFDLIIQLFDFSINVIIKLILMSGLSILLNGVANYLLYRQLGIPLSFINSFGLATINTLANYLPFSGGLIAKGVYLKERYNLAYTKYISATGALYLLFISTNGLIGLISLVIILITTGDKPPLVIFMGYGLMFLCVGFLWFPFINKLVPDRWINTVKRINDGWHILRENKLLVIQLAIVQILSVQIMAIRFSLGYALFNQDVPMLSAMLFSSATILTRLVSFVPGGIGVREAIVAFIGLNFGIDLTVSAVAIGFDRLISAVLVLILGLFFSYYMGNDAINNIDNDGNSAE